MKIDEFAQVLKARPAPNSRQVENLEKIREISRKFHREASISESPCDFELDTNAIVLESGHQPNFIPHLGVLKKVFMLNFFNDKLRKSGRKPICLFGFSDYNISTAQVMYKNKLPSMKLKMEGYEKIGFNLANNTSWKRQNAIGRPTNSEWECMLKKIELIYKNYNKPGIESLDKNINDFLKVINESYERAKNFADMNAFVISQICREVFQLNVMFFRLSDVQTKGIFLDESKRVLSNFKELKSVSSTAVNNETKSFRKYSENLLPFWYQCECGANIELSLNNESYILGICKQCGKNLKVHINDFSHIFPKISPDAIGRNLIYSEGLGTALFVAGTGGSLRYGIISNAISNKISFNTPITLAWKSRDKYLGAAHLTAIHLMMKVFKLELEDFLDLETLSDKVGSVLANSDASRKVTIKNQLKISSKIFQTTYSMLDIFALLGLNKEVLHAWQIDDSSLSKSGDFYILEEDIIYNKPTRLINLPDECISKIYENLIHVENKFIKIEEG